MSNRYSHPSSKRSDFSRCKSRFSCVSTVFQLRFNCASAAFQLRFSCVSAKLRGGFLFGILLVPKYPHSSKSNLWSNPCFVCFSCVSAVFQLAKTGCSPSAGLVPCPTFAASRGIWSLRKYRGRRQISGTGRGLPFKDALELGDLCPLEGGQLTVLASRHSKHEIQMSYATNSHACA